MCKYPEVECLVAEIQLEMHIADARYIIIFDIGKQYSIANLTTRYPTSSHGVNVQFCFLLFIRGLPSTLPWSTIRAAQRNT